MIADACWPCSNGLHAECIAPRLMSEDTDVMTCCCSFVPKGVESNGNNRVLSPDEVTDAKSTGRKRAAMLYPIFPGMLCEWAGLRYAGGGVIPIVGCRGNQVVDVKGGRDGFMQGDRHHGPDKNTLSNFPGNMHRICQTDHNRWHALNDKFYEKERPKASESYLPMEPYYLHDQLTEATEEDLALSEEWWSIRTEKRPPYPFDPPHESLIVVSSNEETLTGKGEEQ